MKTFILFIFAALLFSFSSCRVEDNQEETGFRNVVFIVSDDHAYTALGAYGNDEIRTPSLDKMAGEGVLFTNAFCNSPICSASRQSLLTGKYPQATGVSLLFTPFNDTRNTTIAEHLKNQGFATGLIGKTHFNDWIWSPVVEEWPDFGFDTLMMTSAHEEWRSSLPAREYPDTLEYYSREVPSTPLGDVWNTLARPARVYDEESEGTFLSRKAIEFIREKKDDRFCLWLAYREPHAPFHFPLEYAGKYKPEDMTLPGGSVEDDRWVPEIFRNLNDEQRRGIKAAYYSSVEYLDKNIGLVLDALKEEGLDENTLVVYLGDNGYLLYDHKRFEKHTMWSPSVEIPLIIKGGNLPKGLVTDAVTGGVDIVPTVCDLLDVPAMEEAQGVSFRGVLEGRQTDYKPYAFSLFLEDNMAMVSSKKWKYVFMTGKRDLGLEYATGFGAPGITHMLYDLENDPGETTNLAMDDAHREQLDMMKVALLEWFKDTHPDAGNMPDYLTRDGQLMWFCEPRDVGAEYGGTPLRILETQYTNTK